MRHCGEHTHFQNKEEPRRARTGPRTWAPRLSANGIPFAPISQSDRQSDRQSVCHSVSLSVCSVWYHNSIKIYILLLNNLLLLFASIFMYFLYIYFPLGTAAKGDILCWLFLLQATSWIPGTRCGKPSSIFSTAQMFNDNYSVSVALSCSCSVGDSLSQRGSSGISLDCVGIYDCDYLISAC